MLIFGHCLICTKLDGCYFVERKTPKFPQHKQCDCGKLNKNINEVKLKINTECDIKKFTDYIFANNNSKKYIFESWGYDINNSIELKQEMELQSKKTIFYWKLYIKRSRQVWSENFNRSKFKRQHIL